MKNSTGQGGRLLEVLCADTEVRDPTPLITFSSVYFEGKTYTPDFGDRNSLLILKRNVEKKVSFARAYCGWRAGGCREERELGEGRAFFRWLQRHQLSVEWKQTDFELNSLFSGPTAPVHEPTDEMAKGLSFAIRPVAVKGRKVKLYVQDDDMLALLRFPYGDEADFLGLVEAYVTHRFQWEQWRAPAPSFLDWVKSRGLRPLLTPGQVGLRPWGPVSF